MQSGELTVTNKGETAILLSGNPRTVNVHFEPEPDPVPCNPHHHHDDHLSYEIRHEDEDKRHHHDRPHIHRDRQFYLVIKWSVHDVRTIHWSVYY
jgi:hypothetical protein